MRSARRSHLLEMQTSEDCDDLEGISWEHRNLIRKSNDPEHLDAFTDADWSGDSIDRQSTSGGTRKFGSTTLREFTRGQSCQTLSSGESEYYAAVTTNSRGLAPPTTSGILGNAEAPIQNRFDSSPRGPLKHTETRLLWLQAKHKERKLTVPCAPNPF